MNRLKGLLVLSISGGLLVTAACRQKEQAPAPVAPSAVGMVAVLSELRLDVRHRKSNELIWSSASDGLGLVNYDSIKTGEKASGKIKFNNQSVLELNEKTIVIVMDREVRNDVDRSVLALPAGRVESKIDPAGDKAVEVLVKTRRGWLKASNRAADGSRVEAKFNIAVSETGAMKVQTQTKGITLVVSGVEKPIEANQEISIPEEKGAKPVDVEKISAAAFLETAYKEPPRVDIKRDVEIKRAPVPVPGAPPAAAKKPAAGNAVRITSPTDKLVTTEASVKVSGMISGKMKVFLNDTEFKAGPDGAFSAMHPLTPGVNILTFQIIGPTDDKVDYVVREVMRK